MENTSHVKKRTKIDLSELLPTIAIRSWTYRSDHLVELLFEFYRWLIQSAGQQVGRKRVARYEGLAARLNQRVDLNEGHSSFDAKTWREDLCQRILVAFQMKHPTQRVWLRNMGLDPTKSVTMTNPIRDVNIVQELKRLFAIESQVRRIKQPLYKYKPKPHAVVVTQVKLSLEWVGEEWLWVVWSCCADPNKDDGRDCVNGPLVRQEKGELFADFVTRARLEMESQFEPECTIKAAPINSKLACFVGFTGRDAETGNDVVGGIDVKQFANLLSPPTPIEGEVVAFKGEARAFARSRKGWDENVPLVHMTEDVWVLLPGGKKPSRLMVFRSIGGPIEYFTEGVTDRDTYGMFRGGNGGPIRLEERTALEARARYLLTVDMYRRGFLHMSWKEHQTRNVNAILNPHPTESDHGIYPKQKADAERFCREVRSVLWQHHGDMGPVISRTSCVHGYEEGWHGDGDVKVGGEEAANDQADT